MGATLRKVLHLPASALGSKRRVAVVGALLVGVCAAGIAYAAIPGPDGVIQGCYDTGGNVKVVDALPCPKGYTPFAWNQQGPAGGTGPTGSQGPKGDTGDPGPAGGRGPSDVYVTSSNDSQFSDAVGQFSEPVAHLDLPAGSYALTATLRWINELTSAIAISCSIKVGSFTSEAFDRSRGATPGGGADAGTMAVSGVMTLTADSPADVICHSSAEFVIGSVDLMAVQVGNVNRQ
jgi:hypothetical protein